MRRSGNTFRLSVILLVCFSVISVGLFFVAADYAERNFSTAEANFPSTDTDLSDPSSVSTEAATDEISDITSEEEEMDTVDPYAPLHGEEFSTAPLPHWCDQYIFVEKLMEIAYNEPREPEDENGVTKYGTYFGDPDGQWCTEFAVWCIITAQEELGVEYTNVFYPKSDYSNGCIQWFKRKDGYYAAGTYVPRRGDMIFFEYDGDNTSDHTGLVTGVEYDPADGKLYILTIEGNLPEDYPVGVIRERRLALDDKLIFGYGTFPYQPTVPQQGESQ